MSNDPKDSADALPDPAEDEAPESSSRPRVAQAVDVPPPPPSEPAAPAAEPAAPAEPPATPEDVRRYVTTHLPEIRARVARKVPASRVEDATQDVVVEMLTSKALPASVAAIPAWAATLAHDVLFDARRKRKRRAKYEAPNLEPDEIAVEVALADDPWMATPWLGRAVARDPDEKRTFDMICEKARTGFTYEEIAAAHGMTLAALSNRIFRLKEKYLPLRQKYRRNLALVVIVAAAALAAVLAYLLRPEPTPKPRPLPEPAPSVTALDTPFEPAGPSATPSASSPRPIPPPDLTAPRK